MDGQNGSETNVAVEGQLEEGLGFRTIALDAYGWYNNTLSLGGIRPRGLLPLALAFDVAKAIGRSLTQADLEYLIQKDGDSIICDACGKEFQPVKWAVVNDNLIGALKSGLEFGRLNGQVRWAGSRIVKVSDEGVPRILSFCGPFFYYDPRQRDKATGSEFFGVNRQSCLGVAYRHDENRDDDNRPRPLRCFASALELVEDMQANHERRVAEARRRREERCDRTKAGVGNAFGLVADKRFGIRGGPNKGKRQ